MTEDLVERAVKALTLTTCTFAEHIDAYGDGWSSFRLADVCAVLGALEANAQALLAREREVERRSDETQEVVAALYKAWPDAEDIASDWPLGIIGSIEQIIAERDAERTRQDGMYPAAEANWRHYVEEARARAQTAEASLLVRVGELLAALKQIRLYARCNPEGNYPGILREADAAIAKAEREGGIGSSGVEVQAGLRPTEGQCVAGPWRCFHCDFVTSDRDEAEQHFGPTHFYDPMCKMTDAGQRREYIRLDAAYSSVCDAKKAAEARVAELEAGLKAYQRIHQSVASDIYTAHQGRGNGTTQWMTEDDRDLRRDFRTAGEEAERLLSPTVVEGGGGSHGSSSVSVQAGLRPTDAQHSAGKFDPDEVRACSRCGGEHAWGRCPHGPPTAEPPPWGMQG